MRRTRLLDNSFSILGFRLPVAVGLIAGGVLAASALGAAAERNGVPAITLLVLVPRAVFLGQVWRLATWSFFELGGLSLLFAIVMITFFGRDLCLAWGGLRLLGFWLVASIATGVALCAVGTVLPSVGSFPYVTAWPIVEALTVAWALTFPSRVILFNFVLPVSGMRLIYLTLAMTVVYALLGGFLPFLPHFLAVGLTVAYFRGGSPRYWWLRLKAAWFVKRHSRRLRAVRGRSEPPTWFH